MGYSPWGHKELDMTEHTHEPPCLGLKANPLWYRLTTPPPPKILRRDAAGVNSEEGKAGGSWNLSSEFRRVDVS